MPETVVSESPVINTNTNNVNQTTIQQEIPEQQIPQNLNINQQLQELTVLVESHKKTIKDLNERLINTSTKQAEVIDISGIFNK